MVGDRNLIPSISLPFFQLADNKLHRLDVVVITYRVEMYVDGNRNAVIQSVVSTSSPSKPKPRALISAAPIYLGGAPKHLLRSVSRAGVIGATSGVIGALTGHL